MVERAGEGTGYDYRFKMPLCSIAYSYHSPEAPYSQCAPNFKISTYVYLFPVPEFLLYLPSSCQTVGGGGGRVGMP